MIINGVELTTPYVLNKTLCDKGTERELNIMEIARQDGGKVISSRFAIKTLSLQGIINCDTRAELETAIDELKTMCAGESNELVTEYGGGYRLFYASFKDIIITRANENYPIASFDIEFMVLNPPYGLECDASGVLVETTAYNSADATGDTDSGTATFAGNAEPKPKIKMTLDLAGDVESIEMVNQTTGQQIEVEHAFGDGDVLVIDTDKKTVKLNGDSQDFTGRIIEFEVGANDLQTYFNTTNGITLETEQKLNNASSQIWGTRKLAQSFKVSVDCIMPRLSLLLSKEGAPAGDITIRIETDSAGSPSGTLAGGSEITLAAASIKSYPVWYNFNIAENIDLTHDATYWLVIHTTGGDTENLYRWHKDINESYEDGAAKRYIAAWAALDGDFCFKVYKSLVDANNSTETADSVSEGFDSNANADFGTVIDSYAESNQSSYAIADGSAEAGITFQSFTGNGGKMQSARFYLKRTGSPGKMVAYLYAHSGTFGTNSVPTGSPLATSYPVDLDGISTSQYELVDFMFSGSYTLANGTKYVIALQPSLNSSNCVAVGLDNTSPGHGGNCGYTDRGTYYPESGKDLIFYIHDTGGTTADWNTKLSKLRLPIGATEQIDLDRNNTGNDWYAVAYNAVWQGIRPTSSGVLTMVKATIKKVGSPTGNLTCRVYGVDANGIIDRNNLLGTSTNTISISGLSTSYTEKTFLFDGVNMANNVDLAFEIKGDTAYNGSNYVAYDCSFYGDMSRLSIAAYYEGFPYSIDPAGINFETRYKTYQTGNTVAKTNALDAVSSVIAAATLVPTEVLPSSTSITYQMSSDGTNFENVTKNEEKYFSNKGSALKVKATLSGYIYKSPEITGLAVNFKTAAIIAATTHRVAESFVSGFTGNLGRILLNVKKFGSPTGLVVKIYSNSGGLPNAQLATQTITSALADQFGWVTVNFDTPAALTNGGTYWIVISGTGTDSSNGYLIRTKAGAFAGALKYSTDSGSNYTEFTGEDILLRTFQSAGAQHQIDVNITYTKRYL